MKIEALFVEASFFERGERSQGGDLEGAVDDLLDSPALPLVVVPQPLGLEARLQRPSDVGRAERAQLLFRGL